MYNVTIATDLPSLDGDANYVAIPFNLISADTEVRLYILVTPGIVNKVEEMALVAAALSVVIKTYFRNQVFVGEFVETDIEVLFGTDECNSATPGGRVSIVTLPRPPFEGENFYPFATKMDDPKMCITDFHQDLSLNWYERLKNWWDDPHKRIDALLYEAD